MDMRLIAGFLLVAAALVPANAHVVAQAATGPELPRLVAYYAGWATYSGRDIKDIDASHLTHLIYAFANIDAQGWVAVGDPAVDIGKFFPGDDFGLPFYGNFNQLRLLKQQHPQLKVLIGIGGWTWSGRFSDVALTEESRAAFADSVVRFVERYGFDGVDIDWEYPVSGGLPENSRRPADKQNFTLLMQQLRQALDNLGERTNRHYELTFAGAAAAYYTNNVEVRALAEIVDFVNVMTYDLTGPWEAATGLNSPLQRGVTGWSIADAVTLYEGQGMPKHKIVVGVPFYGYRFQGVAAANDGLHQPFVEATAVMYRDIKPALENAAWERTWHTSAQVPTAYAEGTFMSYEDVESVAAKGAYIAANDLGGAMIWEISQDSADNELLRSLSGALRGTAYSMEAKE